MKTKLVVWVGAAAGLAVAAAGVGQPEKKAPAAKPADAAKAPAAQPDKTPGGAGQPGGMSPEMMKQMQEMMKDAAAPGPEHQQMAKKAGDWTTKTKFSMPGMPAEETTGTAKISMILGGRFLVEDSKGTMMGQPFEAHKLVGYNKATREYEGIWAYTMGTSLMNLTGTSEDGGKTVNYKASYAEAPGPKETLSITCKSIDDDHFTVTLSDAGGQTGGATMETTYERKK